MEIRTILNNGDGKCLTAVVHYTTRSCEGECRSFPGLCPDGGVSKNDKCKKVELTSECYSRPRMILESDVRKSKYTLDEFIQREFIDMLSEWRTGMNAGLRKKMIGKAGGFVNQNGYTGPKEIPMFTGEGVAINPWGWMQIKNDLADAGIADTPIIVGGGLMRNYADAKNIACCNNIGVDASKMATDFTWFEDSKLSQYISSDTTQPNDVLVWNPGAIQLVTGNRNVGSFRVTPSDPYRFSRTTIVDPITGLTLDFYRRYIECDNPGWQMFVGLDYALFELPEDAYEKCDENFGVNDIFHYRVVCGTGGICQPQTAPAPKPTAAFTTEVKTDC